MEKRNNNLSKQQAKGVKANMPKFSKEAIAERRAERLSNAPNVTKTIELPSMVVIREIPAIQVKASSIQLIEIKDDAANKKVIAKTANVGDDELINLLQYFSLLEELTKK